ncbi:MAG: secondary metabolism, biosynthesis of secondary products derived from primary amino acid [Verrucomicrobiales bacterium]|nr:secondary metabolism, biosynthesis of secondary products derived from primary amino acid [Verrucomicrobiales bacterium]
MRLFLSILPGSLRFDPNPVPQLKLSRPAGPVSSLLVLVLHGLLPVAPTAAAAADQPQWGEAWTRNQVSAETGLASDFDLETGKNIQWKAEIGTQTHSTPIISGGRVYVGTNNGNPRDPKHEGDRGVMMCFDEKDGKFLWQLVVPKRVEDRYFDWPDTGMSSPATVEGDRVYTVTNRGEVVCLDARGLANGNDGPYQDEGRHMSPADQPPMVPGPLDADILWICDLTKEAGIWSHDGAHSSILIRGNHLYLNTGTGVDNTHRLVRTPDAPGLLVLDKESGRILARDREKTAPEIFHATWSSPSMATIGGRDHIFFCGGNGLVYSFNPLDPATSAGEVQTLKKDWVFDPDPDAPKREVHRYTTNRQEGPSDIFGMPVYQNGRLYIASGGDIWWGKNESSLQCVDVSGAAPALLWKCPLGKHVLSSASIAGDLVFIADSEGTVFCLNGRTGRPHWTAEMKGEFWASPYVADGRVYLGTRRGDFRIFALSTEKKELFQKDLQSPISATVTAANGAFYIATMKELICVRKAEPK